MFVDGFGGAVAGSACVEVGQEGVLPLAWGPAQASDFGDGTRWQVFNEVCGQALALDGCGLVEDLAHLPGEGRRRRH